ncbi:MAG: type II toxin-antitoxin system VapC family toxin [Patescibacteria group bacterium]
MGCDRHPALLAGKTMVVLDASVILKWLLDEEGSADALRIRDCHMRGEERIIVPSLLFYEVANVIRYRTELSDEEILNLLEILKDLELSVVHLAFSEFEETILYGRAKHISVYDAAYVILAKNLGCELVTADQQLGKAASETWVKGLNG